MAGIEVQTGELFNEMTYKCSQCKKIIDKDNVRPWFDRTKGNGNCHSITYYSKYLERDDEFLCGPVIRGLWDWNA